MKKEIYFGWLLILFFIHNNLHSQIIYTDIPDETPNASYPLDLNNDTIVDFIIQFGGNVGGTGVMCYPQNNNAYSGDFVNGAYLPWALSSSNTICESLATWYDFNNTGTMGLGTNTGYWVGATNKYLALKLIVGTNTFFGWARIDLLSTSSSFTIKDYAFESTPNSCIQAGQTVLNVNENLVNPLFSINPNPFINSTSVKIVNDFQNATLTICNSFGQKVKQENIISGQTFILNRDNLTSGIYFMQLTQDNKIVAIKKLIILDKF